MIPKEFLSAAFDSATRQSTRPLCANTHEDSSLTVAFVAIMTSHASEGDIGGIAEASVRNLSLGLIRESRDCCFSVVVQVIILAIRDSIC